ncbi:MAG: DnaJ domain-containing protein, partial [Microbacterium sp.]
MFDSPLSASAYDVLGVTADVSDDELRRAYRARLRQTHPDTGGDAVRFVQVQRAWELVGAPDARAAYDRGHGFGAGYGPGRTGAGSAHGTPDAAGWRPPSRPADTRPRARSFGQ